MSESAKEIIWPLLMAFAILSMITLFTFVWGRALHVDGDMNRDGRVDIVDLSILAAKIQE
jgi:hypothetical protein